jgi:hypothetical protein
MRRYTRAHAQSGGKSTKPQRRIAHLILTVTVLLISCDLSTLVTPVVPTPLPLDTVIALTAAAASAQTALASTQTAAANTATATASPTPIPSKTPTLTPSPSPTFIFVLASLTPTPITPTLEPPSTTYACQLTDQTPADGAVVAPGVDFEVTWTVRNTGVQTWDSNNTDFIFLSGAKLSKAKVADLPQSVTSGGTIDLKLTLSSPVDSGTYKTAWTLRSGNTEFCKLTLTIKIK